MFILLNEVSEICQKLTHFFPCSNAYNRFLSKVDILENLCISLVLPAIFLQSITGGSKLFLLGPSV